MSETLADMAERTRARTLSFVADLDDDQMMGPRLVLNPLLWEIGHVAWFAERWVLRRQGAASIVDGADALYDSGAVPHRTRWDLPLLCRDDTLAYMRDVLDRILERLASGQATRADRYHVQYAIGHEQMHCEAFTRTYQWHGWPAPFPQSSGVAGPWAGDVMVDGGRFRLGAEQDGRFVFDNEKWAHTVVVAPFSIARAPVTQADFAAFVDDGGYSARALWSDAGWRWKELVGARHPLFWRDQGRLQRRDFDRWVDLEPHRPVCHVAWYEAQAWCRWAGRRLPTEAEWEMAAALDPGSGTKRHHPWGSAAVSTDRANFDWHSGGCVDVGALPAGDSASGCRQMMGNLWEWTSDPLALYPGFVADPYEDYTQPWVGDHYVLKGGCWAGFSVLHRNTYRKYHEPNRRDPFAGFRTCAVG